MAEIEVDHFGDILRLLTDDERADLYQLVDAWHVLGSLERKVLAKVQDRLQEGQFQYGKLTGPDCDHRNFTVEEGEECADGLVYAAVREVYRRGGR